MITKQTFLDAADLIEKNGLVKGLFTKAEGCGFCTVGALAIAAGLKRKKRDGYYCVDEISNWLNDNLVKEKIAIDFLKFAGIMPKNGEVYHASNYIYGWSDTSTQFGVVAVLRAFGNSLDESSN